MRFIDHSQIIEVHTKQKAKQKQTPWQERPILNRYGLSDLKTVGEPRAIKKQSIEPTRETTRETTREETRESNTVEDDSKDTTEVDSIHE